MEIRNIMEEKVVNLIDELCQEDENRQQALYCTSEQCRADAACYVLNRVPQKYVTSGRGLAHIETELSKDTQLQVDLLTLAREGLQRVTTIRRSFYNEQLSGSGLPETGFYFYFPTISGRIFNGQNFEPLHGVEVVLKHGAELVPMIGSRWPNPYPMVPNTPGAYLFWPHPVEAEAESLEKTFDFEISIEAAGFEDFKHYISIPARSQKAQGDVQSAREFHVTDLFILGE